MRTNKSNKREVNVAKFIVNVLNRGTLNTAAQLRVVSRVIRIIVAKDEEAA